MTTAADLLAAGFHGAAIAMRPSDVGGAAISLQCRLEMLEAVLDVESSGHGFDAVGRPKMLPERHIFWRQLATSPVLQRQAAAQQLAYPIRGTLPYPASPDASYALLRQMAAIDADAALASCSWGIGQVMGFNAKRCGYANAAAMVADCMDSEILQFELMLRFCQADPHLLAALRNCDFLTFAAGYNGTGSAASYAARLRAAFQHHAQPVVTAPAKLVAPALGTAPLHPAQLSDPAWLRVRAGFDPDHSADDLNAAELDRLHGVAP